MKTDRIDFSNLERAILSLDQALQRPPANELERDGVILRFGYTFELTWKTAKRALETQGLEATSPKAVIRELMAQGWIHDGDVWMEFLKSRNATSHIYKQEIASEVYQAAIRFLPECQALLKKLVQETKQ